MAPKRKADGSGDEWDHDDAPPSSPERPISSAAPKKTAKTAAKKSDSSKAKVKKPKVDKPATAKKPKAFAPDDASEASGTSSAQVGVDSEGGRYLDLGKKKRVTVRTFKGSTLIDVREFYGDDNDLKPGKKGISLSQEQWDVLRNNTDIIDTFVKKLKK